jgi:copper chaperone CopZ
MSVTNALESVKGITNVQVDLPTGVVTFEETEPVDEDTIKAAIDKIGFSVE